MDGWRFRHSDFACASEGETLLTLRRQKDNPHRPIGHSWSSYRHAIIGLAADSDTGVRRPKGTRGGISSYTLRKYKFPFYSSYNHLDIFVFYKKHKASAERALAPTANHPDWVTCLLVIMVAVSQIRCLMPLKHLKVKVQPTANLERNWRTTGQLAKPAASTELSRCQPKVGAIRYRAPKM